MVSLFTLVTFIFYFTGLSIAQTYNDNTCGIRPLISTYDQERVVNGTEAIPGDWGWAVCTDINL